MTKTLSADELRSLRAYGRAMPPVPIKAEERMFRRLYDRGLAIGAVAYDARGDPFGVIQLTERGRAALEQAGPG
jgi:hypothetical protein